MPFFPLQLGRPVRPVRQWDANLLRGGLVSNHFLIYSGLQCELSVFPLCRTTFVADLNRCRPTLFLSVPRLWTKVGEAMACAANLLWRFSKLTLPLHFPNFLVPAGCLQEDAAQKVGEATQNPSH